MLAGLLCSLYLILFILGIGSNSAAFIRAIRVYRLIRRFEWTSDSNGASASRPSNSRVGHLLWLSIILIITNLSLLLCLCFLISDVLSQGWRLGSALCWYYWWSENIAKIFVAFILSAVSLERYLCNLAKSIWRILSKNSLTVPTVVILGFVLVVILAAPLQPYVGVKTIMMDPASTGTNDPINLTKCVLSEYIPKIPLRYHVIGSFLFAYLFPLAISIFCFVSMARKSSKNVVTSSEENDTREGSLRVPSLSSVSSVTSVNVDKVESISKRITVISASLITLFILCWSPYWLTTLMVQFGNHDHIVAFTVPFNLFVCHILPYVNATVAGLLLMALGKRVKSLKLQDVMRGCNGAPGGDGNSEGKNYHEMMTRETYEHSSSSLNTE